ncbi:putative disease resistance protein RGA1 [Pistacia vera]|uniref:putative disease resistance protein RGA1 n=1 Tax=Pistacia vera TaxID=55513 RepID=UPI001263C454|nr:putative disease resistance protein RGA1 [Pistacia vera]
MAEALVTKILEQLDSEQMKSMVDMKEVEKLRTNLSAIQQRFEDVEKKQVEDSRVRDWLRNLECASYDIDDVLDEWNTTRKSQIVNAPNLWKRVRNCLISSHIFGWQDFLHRNNIATRIKAMIETLDKIVKKKDDFGFSLTTGIGVEKQPSSPVIYLPKVARKDYDKNTIIELLIKSRQTTTFPIISIVEMIGTEKTTLSKLVVEDNRVKENFKTIITVYLHKYFDEILIAKAILKSLGQEVAPNLDKLETLLGKIHQCLEGKKFLLVLDDVWINIPIIWKQFKKNLGDSQESRILVTTSTIITAKMIETTNMVVLGSDWQSSLSLFRTFGFSSKTSEDKILNVDCWSLFSKFVFSTLTHEERKSTRHLYKKIVSTCNGSPSVVKILGSLLNSKTSEEWQSVHSDLLELEKVKTSFPRALLLSYYELPSKLKKCFLYCAIFPKRCVINKDNLIKLWMAQGYLKVPERNDIELVGEEYFSILAMRHFFQDFERSVYDGSIIRCKMPDKVHDFAKFLTEKECLTIIGGCRPEPEDLEALHEMRIDVSIPDSSNPNKKKLRSLVVNNTKILGELSSLFDQLTCLRTLDLSCCSIEEIPSNIKKLIYLRYINLSDNEKIKELPDTLCELDYLQTLDLSNCYRLEKLPHRIGNLRTLRHLLNHRTCLSCMPIGIKELTCLQTLMKFVVGNDNSKEKKGSLECLKYLKQLKGLVSITGLGNVSEVEKINEGKLEEKENICGLSLRFDGWTIVDDEKVFKSFNPPPNLEELVIQRYTGETMALDWIENLAKLRMLKLMSCFELMEFPGLGKLSSLESLIICNMRSLKKVDNGFLGINTDGASSSSSGTSIAFPKLRYLKFWNMIEWEELAWGRSTNTSVKILPCLRYLELDSCPKLKSLSLLGELPSLESLIIKRMNGMKIANNEFWETISSASSSTVYTFPVLINLEFEDIKEWEEWDVKLDGRFMPNLLSLRFHKCPELVKLPNDLLQRPALQKLLISDCRILRENYVKETGTKWSRISHISYIQIDSSEYVHGNLIKNTATDSESQR